MRRRSFLAGGVSALHAAARADGAAEAPMYLLSYDHGGLVLWGIPHFLDKFSEALQWLDRYPHFKIGLDNEAYMYDYLAEHDPTALKAVRSALEKYPGRLGIGSCTYGQPLMCFLNDESNLRQIQFAMETVERRFGRRLTVYLMSEHAMHSQVPQMLAGFGFWGAILRTHFMMYGYNPTFDAAFGRWVGVDGTAIPAVPTYNGEGAQFGKTTVDDWILTRCPGPDCRGESLEKFRSQFGHMRPLIATRADDAGLRREELVAGVEGKPEYEWVLLEDLPRIFRAPEKELRTGPNDFIVRMPWGYCGNEIWNRSREAEVSVLMAERLAALAWHASKREWEAEVEESWRNLLIAQHHDIQICGLVPDARKYLGRSLASSKKVAGEALAAIASRMRGGGQAQITVFNPSSWPRREWVEATVSLPNGYARDLVLKQGASVAPTHVVSALRASSGAIQQARLAAYADVPPLGCVSYSVEPAAREESGASGPGETMREDLHVLTRSWDITLHSEGGIASLVSRKTGKPVFAPGRRSAFFAGRIGGASCESSGSWRIVGDSGSAPWVNAREHGTIGGIPYRCDLRMWRDSPRIDLRARFEFEREWIGRLSENRRDASSPFVHEEKLRLKFFPAVEETLRTGVRDLPFAIAETRDRYIQGIYWTALAGPGSGVAVFNRGAMALVREDDGGVSAPLAYSMYYVWGTRILDGTYEYELALWPFETPWQVADLHRHALEYAFPMAACATAPGDGTLGDQYRPVNVEAGSALVTALYVRGGKTFLRLFADQGRSATVRINGAGAGLVEVDLRNRAKGPLENPVALSPWQIRTVSL